MIGLTEGFIATLAIAWSVHTADFHEMVKERYEQGYWWKYKPEYVEDDRIAIPFITEQGRFVLFQIGEE